jgi:hypothetical protein
VKETAKVAKFAKTGVRPAVTAPIVTTGVRVSTHQGGIAYSREAKGELFLLAVTNFVSEDTFYESGKARDARFENLIHQVTNEDPAWMQQFIPWLRDGANMRSASIVAAAEYVRAGGENGRRVIASAIQRADEPAEMLAYWFSRYGRGKNLAMAVKRGVADAAERLYTEPNYLKWNGSGSVDFADVIMITHPSPSTLGQTDLFKYILNKKYKNVEGEVPSSLKMIWNRQAADNLSREDLLKKPEIIRAAGYTWENISGKGEMDAAGWEAAIPQMGVFALIRNLRNFDQAGIGREAQQKVIAKLTNPEDVKKSRALPMRFFQAYKAVESERWKPALDEALTLTLQNVPVLKGRSLILVDTSGSMWTPMSNRSQLMRHEAASIFGAALAARAELADLYAYDNTAYPVPFGRGASIFSLMQKLISFGRGGTNTWGVAKQLYRNHDRVVILTDEQTGGYYGNQDPGVSVMPVVFTFNLAGYSPAHGESGKGRYSFGGLSDASFKAIELLENHRDGVWPWESK